MLEVERVQKVRRRIEAWSEYCRECARSVEFVDLADLARMFEISMAEATRQLRRRLVHIRPDSEETVAVCAESLLQTWNASEPMLAKRLTP